MLALLISSVRSHTRGPFLLCRKAERKITFAQFQNALKLVAEKKYPGDKGGYRKLVDKIVAGKGPVAAGTTVSVEDVMR